MLMTHTRLQIQLKEVLWQSSFTVNERQAGCWVEGRGSFSVFSEVLKPLSPQSCCSISDVAAWSTAAVLLEGVLVLQILL